MFLEGCDGNKLLHSEQFIVKRKNINKPHILEFLFLLHRLYPIIFYRLSVKNGCTVHGKALFYCLT